MRFVRLILITCVLLANSQMAICEENPGWLTIADFGPHEDWQAATGSLHTGDGDGRGLSVDSANIASGLHQSRIYLKKKLDLEQEQFDDDDYIYIEFNLDVTGVSVILTFYDDWWRNDAFYYCFAGKEGENWRKVSKADFTVQGDPRWTGIERVQLRSSKLHGPHTVRYDSLQLVKANPSTIYLPVVFK